MRVIKEKDTKVIQDNEDFEGVVDFLTTHCYDDFVVIDTTGDEIGLVLGEHTEDYTVYYDLINSTIKAFDDMSDLASYIEEFTKLRSLAQFVEVKTTLSYKRV